MSISFLRLLMLREAIASVAIETGHRVSLSELLVAMTEQEELMDAKRAAAHHPQRDGRRRQGKRRPD